MTGPPEGAEEEPTGARSLPKGFSIPAAGTPPGPPEPEQKHSAVVGFMSVPVHSRFPIRRSTLVMVIAFLGLGTLLYFNPPQGSASGAVVRTPNGDFFVPGATRVDTTTTTTVPPTTKTTTTTTTGAVATTTSPAQPTTTTVPRTAPTSTPTSSATSTTSTTAATSATTSTTSRSPGTGTSSTATTP